MTQIIDGKAIAAQVKDEIAAKTAKMERKPGLAVILVGDDPASHVYVRNKTKNHIISNGSININIIQHWNCYFFK